MSPTRKMGRQMVSISFKTAIEKYGDSSLYLLPPEIPSSNLEIVSLHGKHCSLEPKSQPIC